MLTLGQQLVVPNRNVLDDEGSSGIGEGHQAGPDDEHHGAVDRTTTPIERHLSLDRTETLAEDRVGDGTRDDERRKHCLSERCHRSGHSLSSSNPRSLSL
jgi:hypothetical protein